MINNFKTLHKRINFRFRKIIFFNNYIISTRMKKKHNITSNFLNYIFFARN